MDETQPHLTALHRRLMDRNMTLHEALASAGYTSRPRADERGQGREVYDPEGRHLGRMTAQDCWDCLGGLRPWPEPVADLDGDGYQGAED